MKISVIVPVYNVGQYLNRCLDSIINQSYKSLEIILINDGSTDQSLSICRSFEKKDKRIVVLNQLNGGLSNARNSGLIIAKGDYIVFVDSDDFVEKEYIMKMFNVLNNNNADLVACGYNQVNDITGEKIVSSEHLLFSSSDLVINICDREIDEFMMKRKSELSNVVWNKMYKTSIISENNIRFMPNKEIFSEDILFNYSYFLFCKKFCLIEEKLYNYAIRANSLSNVERPQLTKQLLNLAYLYNCFADLHNKKQLINRYKDWVYAEMCFISLSVLDNHGIKKVENVLQMIHNNDRNIASIKKCIKLTNNFNEKIRLILLTKNSTLFSTVIISILYQGNKVIKRSKR